MSDWHLIGTLETIPEGRLWPVEVAGRAWVIVREGESVRCFYDRCSHQDVKLSEFAQLDAAGGILCFAHGARFCKLTGEPLCFPGKFALWQAEIQQREGELWLRVPQQLPEDY